MWRSTNVPPYAFFRKNYPPPNVFPNAYGKASKCPDLVWATVFIFKGRKAYFLCLSWT